MVCDPTWRGAKRLFAGILFAVSSIGADPAVGWQIDLDRTPIEILQPRGPAGADPGTGPIIDVGPLAPGLVHGLRKGGQADARNEETPAFPNRLNGNNLPNLILHDQGVACEDQAAKVGPGGRTPLGAACDERTGAGDHYVDLGAPLPLQSGDLVDSSHAVTDSHLQNVDGQTVLDRTPFQPPSTGEKPWQILAFSATGLSIAEIRVSPAGRVENVSVANLDAVEPATLAIVGVGLLAMVLWRRGFRAGSIQP